MKKITETSPAKPPPGERASFDEQCRAKALRWYLTNYGKQNIADVVLGKGSSEKERLNWVKRWNNYERGFKMGSDTLHILQKKTGLLLAHWIWWGVAGDLPSEVRDRLSNLQIEAALEKVRQQ